MKYSVCECSKCKNSVPSILFYHLCQALCKALKDAFWELQGIDNSVRAVQNAKWQTDEKLLLFKRRNFMEQSSKNLSQSLPGMRKGFHTWE